MRIGLITGEYPPMQGGVGDFSRELAQALVTLGHEIHVITRIGCPGAKRTPEVNGRAAHLTVHAVVPHWGWRSLRQVRDLTHQLELDVLNIQYQAAAFDLHPAINAYPIYSSLSGVGRGRRAKQQGKLSRPALVVTFHDLKVPYLFPKAGPLRDGAVTLLARTADAVIATNRADELALSARRISRTMRIPIGSNVAPVLPESYDRETWRAGLNIGPDDFLLGFFGFFNARKGIQTLIRALAALDPFHHLLFIGGTVGSSDLTNRAYANRMIELIEALGLSQRVHFTGYLPPPDVSAAFASLDLCILPYAEGVSFHHGTLVAALVHRQAIISTLSDIKLPELSHRENVWLVPPGDVDALVAAVASLAANPMRRRILAQGAAQLAAHFSWERIAARTADLFQSVQRER